MMRGSLMSIVKRCGLQQPTLRRSLGRLVPVLLGVVILGGCREELHHNLAERSANEIIVALAQSDIPARKADDGESWTVTVPSVEYQRALTVLAARNLPREETDIFALLEGSGGLVPSVEEEHLRKVSILTTELEQTFLSMDSVVDAHVHAVLPRTSGLRGVRGEAEPPSASVVIVYRAGLLPPGDESIRSILRGAIPSLASEQISTVLVETEMPEATSATFVALGPFTVSASSARGLRWTLAGLLATVVGLLMLLVWIRLRPSRSAAVEAA
jgi:type III secretion protein J